MTTKAEALEAVKAIYLAHTGYRPDHPLYSPTIEAGIKDIIDFIKDSFVTALTVDPNRKPR